jgi:hypothetical protein
MQSYDITSDAYLKYMVRTITGYADTPNELPESKLDSLIEASKLQVHTKTDANSWYSDRGLGMVLLGVTSAKCKSMVENHSIQSWDFGAGKIEARDQRGNAVQYDQYESMIQDGMKKANVGSSSPLPSVSNSWIGGR